MSVKGFINSIQSLGTVDGPGVRFVVFMQGCNLRCGCCHNPETWEIGTGTVCTPQEILEKVIRYKEYFGNNGGITLSGGEPLLQAEFAYELFRLCHENAINTCLDTSGSLFNGGINKLLSETDRVLLDIKYTENELYKKYAGCDFKKVLSFLSVLNEQNIPTTLRQVIIPTLNNTEENILALKDIARAHPCVDKIELLPFKNICITKYENMNIPFPFKAIPLPDGEEMSQLNALLN